MRPLFDNVNLWKPSRVARYGKSRLAAWAQSLANEDKTTLVVATALLRLSTAKCLTPVAILPRRPGRLEGDALGKESWWNEAACNPDASDHNTAFSLIFGS
jgi:hypothetical protein